MSAYHPSARSRLSGKSPVHLSASALGLPILILLALINLAPSSHAQDVDPFADTPRGEAAILFTGTYATDTAYYQAQSDAAAQSLDEAQRKQRKFDEDELQPAQKSADDWQKKEQQTRTSLAQAQTRQQQAASDLKGAISARDAATDDARAAANERAKTAQTAADAAEGELSQAQRNVDSASSELTRAKDQLQRAQQGLKPLTEATAAAQKRSKEASAKPPAISGQISFRARLGKEIAADGTGENVLLQDSPDNVITMGDMHLTIEAETQMSLLGIAAATPITIRNGTTAWGSLALGRFKTVNSVIEVTGSFDNTPAEPGKPLGAAPAGAKIVAVFKVTAAAP